MVRGWRSTRGRASVLAVGMALVTSACFFEAAEYHESVSPETRPWFCNAAGDGTPATGHGNGNHVHEAYAGKVKGPLPWDVCKQLAAQLDVALKANERWPTKGRAEADGWSQVAQYIPGLGTHHAKGLRLSNAFDPADPTYLIYGGREASAPLVGLAFGTGYANGVPPEGFAGSNDWYHLHRKVCMRGVFEILAGAEEISDGDCSALGGTQIGINVFLLHLWIIPGYEHRVDLFSSANPCLLANGPAPAGDPCWIDVSRDPATVPTTTPTTHPAHPT